MLASPLTPSPGRIPGWLRAVNAVLCAGAAYVALHVAGLLIQARLGADTGVPLGLLAGFMALFAVAPGRTAWTGRSHGGALGSAREALWAGFFVTFAALRLRAAADPRVAEGEAYLRAAIAAGAAWLAIAAIWRQYARGRRGRPSEPGAGSAA